MADGHRHQNRDRRGRFAESGKPAVSALTSRDAMTPTKAIQAFDKRHNEFSEMLLTIHESEDSSRERCEKVIEGYAEVADAFSDLQGRVPRRLGQAACRS